MHRKEYMQLLIKKSLKRMFDIDAVYDHRYARGICSMENSRILKGCSWKSLERPACMSLIIGLDTSSISKIDEKRNDFMPLKANARLSRPKAQQHILRIWIKLNLYNGSKYISMALGNLILKGFFDECLRYALAEISWKWSIQ